MALSTSMYKKGKTFSEGDLAYMLAPHTTSAQTGTTGS